MTHTLTLSIDPALFASFPALRVGGLVVAHLDRAATALTRRDLETRWTTAAIELGRGGITIDNVTRVPVIRAWRDAFAACGVQASVHVGSVEALVRRVLNSATLAAPVHVATLADAISARHLAPLNGYDIDALPAREITIRLLHPDTDWFLPLGARPTDIPPDPRVVVYAAGTSVLNWSFNHRGSRQICLRGETRRAVFFSEAVVTNQARRAAAALSDLADVLSHCGADVGPAAFADRATPHVALNFARERASP